LKIDFPEGVAGVGRLQETQYKFQNLREALYQGLPVDRLWKAELGRSAQRPRRAAAKPQQFRGWRFAGKNLGPDEILVYLSVELLARAMNSGSLTPLGGVDLLHLWDLLAPTRDVVSKSRLASCKGVLRALGVVPLSFLGANGLHDVNAAPWTYSCDKLDDDFGDDDDFENEEHAPLPPVQAEDTESVFLKRTSGVGWSGLLRVVMCPVVVTYPRGITIRRAAWIAQFPRKPSSESRFPWPLCYFDCRGARLVPGLDALDAGVVDDFSKCGNYHLLDAAKLWPPENLRAK